MPVFSRGWRFIERIFPPAGPSIVQPREVYDDISLVHEMLAPGLHIPNVTFFSDFQIVATGGVTTQVLVPEPPAGLILFPVAWSLSYDGAAAIRVDARVIKTVNAVDPWGDWLPTAGAGGNQDIAHVRVYNSIFVLAPAIPVPRGNQLRATFNAPAALSNVASNYYGILIPGELVRVEHWTNRQTSMQMTSAL